MSKSLHPLTAYEVTGVAIRQFKYHCPYLLPKYNRVAGAIALALTFLPLQPIQRRDQIPCIRKIQQLPSNKGATYDQILPAKQVISNLGASVKYKYAT